MMRATDTLFQSLRITCTAGAERQGGGGYAPRVQPTKAAASHNVQRVPAPREVCNSLDRVIVLENLVLDRSS